MDAKDIEYFQAELTKSLDEILAVGKETIDDMTDSGEIFADPADRATAESDRSFTLRLRDRERQFIKKINKALARIEEGEFGICLSCGDDISIARLKARPMTSLCINCKSKQEADEKLRGN